MERWVVGVVMGVAPHDNHMCRHGRGHGVDTLWLSRG